VVVFAGPLPQTFFWLMDKQVLSICPSESFDSRVRDARGLVDYSVSEFSEEDDFVEETGDSSPSPRHVLTLVSLVDAVGHEHADTGCFIAAAPVQKRAITAKSTATTPYVGRQIIPRDQRNLSKGSR
jgi:hypothetical protein